MIGRHARTWILGIFTVLGSSAARAQTLGVTPTVTDSSLGESSKMRLGVVLAPMPLGTLEGSIGGFSGSSDAKFAFAIVPTFDFSFNQFFFAGLAPQFILNVKAKDASDSSDAGQELDLRARVGGIAKVADTIRLFGYFAPGYSIIMLPNKPSGMDNPAGFVLGFAGGTLIDISEAVYLTGEVGYQLGFQTVEFGGVSGDFKTNYLHIGIGLGFRL